MAEEATVSTRTRAQRRASQTRGLLLRAAVRMFSEKGIEVTTIEAITESADVGKGTFYRHFANKDAVVSALACDLFAGLAAKVRSADPKAQNLREMLDQLLDAHAAFAMDRATADILLLFSGRVLLSLPPNASKAYMEELQDRIAPHIAARDGIAARIRRLTAALIGYACAPLPLTMIGLTRNRMDGVLRALKSAWLDACLTFLEADGATAAAAGAPAGAEKKSV